MIPRSDLLIIECDSEELARAAMNLGTWFGRIASIAFRRRRIALVQTSTAAKLKDDLDAAFKEHGQFRSLLIVGHSDENGLAMVSNAILPWTDVGKLIRRFQPKRLFLCACRAGSSKAVRGVFENARSLREIYGSPVDLLKIHTAPMGVLIGIELHHGRIKQDESAGLRLASFLNWGVQTYCWHRDEMGPGNELALQSWDALANLLGATNWDLSDANRGLGKEDLAALVERTLVLVIVTAGCCHASDACLMLRRPMIDELSDAVHQVHRLHLQRMRQLDDVQQGDVPFAALDSANVITMQLRKLGQTLLRQPALHAEFAHSLAEDCSRIGTSHPIVMLDR